MHSAVQGVDSIKLFLQLTLQNNKLDRLSIPRLYSLIKICAGKAMSLPKWKNLVRCYDIVCSSLTHKYWTGMKVLVRAKALAYFEVRMKKFYNLGYRQVGITGHAMHVDLILSLSLSLLSLLSLTHKAHTPSLALSLFLKRV